MSLAFTWEALASRVVFREGGLDEVPAEVDRTGASRILLVGGGSLPSFARVRELLGERVVAAIEGVAQHIPAESAAMAVARAHESGADGAVTLGGGSATGLGKAVAVGCDVPLVAIPTTYAGSEMTPMWGRTEAGRKVTARDDRALPVAVIYDPALCRGMPARLAAASGMNALAHCLEALWLPTTSPMTAALAELGVRRLIRGLPRVVADTDDVDAHAQTLVGACLAGVSLAQAGIGIHHRTCHVLGGGWNLPHAETHAVVLPHSTELITSRSAKVRQRLSDLLGSPDPALRVFSLLEELDLPRSLADIGMPEHAVGEAAARVVAASPGDQFADEADVTAMLAAAYAGGHPTAYPPRDRTRRGSLLEGEGGRP